MSNCSRDRTLSQAVVRFGLPCLLLVVQLTPAIRADDSEYVPVAGEFPPPGVGLYLAGELVAVDHINRRGALRLVGDGVDDRYHGAPSHEFAILPYGTLRYHGAPAELRDIPIGTVLHGRFVLPREGEEWTPPRYQHWQRFSKEQTQALVLEDDFSFYQRQERSWKIESVETQQGKLSVSPIGPTLADGLNGPQTFEIDPSTRVWQGRQFATLEDLSPGQEVQVNLTWTPDWKNGFFHAADVWIDQQSREVATQTQRNRHIRHQRHRWLAGWVDEVQHEPDGKGIVTLTLFGGMDPSLYDEVRSQAQNNGGAAIAAAEWTLRSWWQEHDSKRGPIIGLQEDPDPPTGSSGIQLQVQIAELLEGYRPGRIVRFRPHTFPNVKLPPEERIKHMEDRDRSRTSTLP